MSVYFQLECSLVAGMGNAL